MSTFEERDVTVGQLRELVLSGGYEIEIDTPDGFQPVVQWFDKGVMPLVLIETNSHRSRCAANHLVQLLGGEWLPAAEIRSGHLVLTKTGPEQVVSAAPSGSEECFDFEVAHVNHRYWGDGISSHNSGKSYVVSGNIVRNAQRMGVTPIIIDTEDALYEDWVRKLGVDADPDSIYRAHASLIDDVAKIINEVMEQYRAENAGKPREEQQKVLFVIDSLGMLQTPTEVEQFDKADMKGDMGRKPRQLKALVTNCIRLFNGWEVGLVATNHTYKSQNQYEPDDVISGGAGFVYAASMVVSLNKAKLRDEVVEGGKKKKVVQGIVSKMKCVKSRFSKPFEEVEVNIPYSTGMDPYSGVFEMIKKSGSITQSGSWYTATYKDGTTFKQQGDDFPHAVLDRLMSEFSDEGIAPGVDETPAHSGDGE